MFATSGWVSRYIVRMRNQTVKGWRATAAQLLQLGKLGLLGGLSPRAASHGGTDKPLTGWDTPVPPQDAPLTGWVALNNMDRGGCFRLEMPFYPHQPKGGQCDVLLHFAFVGCSAPSDIPLRPGRIIWEQGGKWRSCLQEQDGRPHRA